MDDHLILEHENNKKMSYNLGKTRNNESIVEFDQQLNNSIYLTWNDLNVFLSTKQNSYKNFNKKDEDVSVKRIIQNGDLITRVKFSKLLLN